MSETITVYTRGRVDLGMLGALVEEEGGRAQSPGPPSWIIKEGQEDIIWVVGNVEIVDHIIDDDLSVMTDVLGSAPVCSITIHARRGRRSLAMAFGFAAKCMKKWPGVMSNNIGDLYTLAQVETRLREGRWPEPLNASYEDEQ